MLSRSSNGARSGPFVWFLIGVCGIFACGAAGCGSTEASLEPLSSEVVVSREGARVEANGRLRDVRPAVLRALGDAGMTTISESWREPEGLAEFELVGLAGEPGSLRVRFDPVGEGLAERRQVRPLSIEVRVGRFGEPERERSIAARVAREVITFAARVGE